MASTSLVRGEIRPLREEYKMPKVRVHSFSLSLDGYGAGPDQGLDHPLGVGGQELHRWAFATRTYRQMSHMEGGDEGIDDGFAAQGDVGIGATIMGRNMFGPIRGSRRDEDWRGWWGDNPPFHHPVFVLTHQPRASITMEDGTTFHFVTDGINAALERALEAAQGNDVRIGGGAATIQQYLRAGLIHEMHLAIVPILLGCGERLFDHLNRPLAYKCVEFVSSSSVVHARLVRNGSTGCS
jgi:dihydrofolate reductase